MQMTLEQVREYDAYSLHFKKIFEHRLENERKNMMVSYGEAFSLLIEELSVDESVRNNNMCALAFINFVADGMSIMQDEPVVVSYEDEPFYGSSFCAVSRHKGGVDKIVISNYANLAWAMDFIVNVFKDYFGPNAPELNQEEIAISNRYSTLLNQQLNKLCTKYDDDEEPYYTCEDRIEACQSIVELIRSNPCYMTNRAFAHAATHFVLGAIEFTEGLPGVLWWGDDDIPEDCVSITLKRNEKGKLETIQTSGNVGPDVVLNLALLEYDRVYTMYKEARGEYPVTIEIEKAPYMKNGR